MGVNRMMTFRPMPGGERFRAAILSDALDRCGLREQVLEHRLAPFVPGSRAFIRSARVRLVPSGADEPQGPYRAATDLIGGFQRGEMVVIATGDPELLGFADEQGEAVNARGEVFLAFAHLFLAHCRPANSPGNSGSAA